MKDQIKHIPRTCGYFASKMGRIYHLKRDGLKEVKGWIEDQFGVPYRRVEVTVINNGNKGRSGRYVHRLVLFTFSGDPPDSSRKYARHLDGNSMNNRFDNLKWGTALENMRDKKECNGKEVGRGVAEIEDPPF